MHKNIKCILTIFKVILSIVLFVGMLFFGVKAFDNKLNINSDELLTFNDSVAISGDEKCYILNEYLYLVNADTGTIQLFDKQGQFEKRLQLPTNGGTVWVGVNEQLYVFCVRTDSQFEITGTDYKVKRDIYYNNPSEFYNSLNLTEQNLCKLKANIVSYTENNIIYEIPLDVKMNFFSRDICMILYIICTFGLLIITGLLKKFTFLCHIDK